MSNLLRAERGIDLHVESSFAQIQSAFSQRTLAYRLTLPYVKRQFCIVLPLPAAQRIKRFLSQRVRPSKRKRMVDFPFSLSVSAVPVMPMGKPAPSRVTSLSFPSDILMSKIPLLSTREIGIAHTTNPAGPVGNTN